MKNVGTIAAAVVLAAVLGFYMCTFQVRFTEVAIKKTWGKPGAHAITEPGLKFRWPRPIQSVVIYDKRTHVLEDRTEETRTVDGKALLLTTYTLWRIADPAKFHMNFPGGVEDGARKLRTTVETQKHTTTGKREFRDFVSTDPKERKIRVIEKEMLAAIRGGALEAYGIEVLDFGIKKLGLPESVTTAIFESMRAREEANASRYIAEGQATAQKILADAREREQRILAEARRKASEIETEAQRVISEYYKEFSEHPELRIYLDTLDTVKEALRQRTTLILDTNESPWSIFNAASRARVPQEGGSQTGGASASPDGEKTKTTAPTE